MYTQSFVKSNGSHQRGSGRTFKMMFEVMQRVLKGDSCTIVCANNEHRKEVEAMFLSLYSHNIAQHVRFITKYDLDKLKGLESTCFIDHYTTEVVTADKMHELAVLEAKVDRLKKQIKDLDGFNHSIRCSKEAVQVLLG